MDLSSLCEIYTLSPEDRHLLALCLDQQLLSLEQIDTSLRINSGKQVWYILNQLLTPDQLTNVMRSMEKSLLCPKCMSLNFINVHATDLFCIGCGEFINIMQVMKREPPLIRNNTDNLRFGNYQMMEILGQGSMGIVYKAKHVKLDRYVAVKVLKNELKTPEIIAFFDREATTAGKLKHPTIIDIYDAGDSNGMYYIIMEYIQGRRLSDIIKQEETNRNSFPLQEKLRVVSQIAQGLYHAHQAGIIHRDIKPDNIMVTANWEVKITDFGLARTIKNSVSLTQHNQRLGTPLYMSPEQIDGLPLTGSTDIYSLGIVFYEMLTGKTPFYHSQISVLFQKIMTANVLRPRTLHPEIPQIVEDICLKAMAKSPADRFSNANEIVMSIEGYFRHGDKKTVSIASHVPPSVAVNVHASARHIQIPPPSAQVQRHSSIEQSQDVTSSRVAIKQAIGADRNPTDAIAMVPTEPTVPTSNGTTSNEDKQISQNYRRPIPTAWSPNSRKIRAVSKASIPEPGPRKVTPPGLPHSQSPTTNDSPPVVDHDSSPVIHNDSSPVIHNDSSPVVNEEQIAANPAINSPNLVPQTSQQIAIAPTPANPVKDAETTPKRPSGRCSKVVVDSTNPQMMTTPTKVPTRSRANPPQVGELETNAATVAVDHLSPITAKPDEELLAASKTSQADFIQLNSNPYQGTLPATAERPNPSARKRDTIQKWRPPASTSLPPPEAPSKTYPIANELAEDNSLNFVMIEKLAWGAVVVLVVVFAVVKLCGFSLF